MNPSPREELALLIRGGWRLIIMETFEEERALGLIERVAESLERKFEPWTLARGFEGDGQSSGSLDAALRAVAVREAPSIFVILDAHRLLDDALAIRRLRDLLPLLASRRQVMVFLGPTIDLPSELVREAGQVDLPLPAEPELRVLFQRILDKSAGIDSTPERLGEAVRGSLGLTSSEAMRVLRKACRMAGGLNEEAVGIIVREKRRALRRTPSLTFHDEQGGLAEVGGLGEILNQDGDLRSLPCHFADLGGIDGFYAARLRRL